MAYYAVIDTNVLVSALLSRHADSATVLLVERMILGDLIPVLITGNQKHFPNRTFIVTPKEMLDILNL